MFLETLKMYPNSDIKLSELEKEKEVLLASINNVNESDIRIAKNN